MSPFKRPKLCYKQGHYQEGTFFYKNYEICICLNIHILITYIVCLFFGKTVTQLFFFLIGIESNLQQGT